MTVLEQFVWGKYIFRTYSKINSVLKLHSKCYFVRIVCSVIQSAQTPTLKYQIWLTI